MFLYLEWCQFIYQSGSQLVAPNLNKNCLLILKFVPVLDADSLITLQCNQVQCLTTLVQHQCIVNDSAILRWKIIDETMTTLETETYSTGDSLDVSFTPITIGSDFSTDLSLTSPSIISNISFTVQSSFNGYTILCEDIGDNESCTINIQGECLIELFDIIISYSIYLLRSSFTSC